MEEDKYEWGASSAPQLPPHMLPLLTAPHRWRVKLAKSHAGAFSSWRVALFVKEHSSEALFCRYGDTVVLCYSNDMSLKFRRSST